MTGPARLAYSLTTVPSPLTAALSGPPRLGRLEITAALAAPPGGTLRCRGIIVTVPTGSAGNALTAQPERIATAYLARRSWHVTRNDSRHVTVFTLRPAGPGPLGEAAFDHTTTVTLILDHIPLTGPADVSLEVSEDTAAAAQPFASATTSLPVTILRAPSTPR